MAINPFIWDRPIDDPQNVTGMDGFAEEVALTVKGQTNVAIFGARNTGKSSFLTKLEHELTLDHGNDGPAHVVVRVDLKRALSISAFIAAVHDAMTSHPIRSVKEKVREQLGVLEKEVGFDIRLVKATIRRGGRAPTALTELLHEQLVALTRLGDHVVVIFDEFQRLNRCPDEPLAIIGSALMGHRASHVSIVFTGSIREYLEMMLNNSREPIFNQAANKQLPEIPASDLFAYLELRFQATNSPIEEDALTHLLKLTQCHPQRTQQLAWQAWPQPRGGRTVTLGDVQIAWEALINEPNSDVAIIEETLANGSSGDTNERKALYLLADHHGEGLSSESLTERYGLTSQSGARDAMPRLQRRGLVVDRNGEWKIIDPLLADWLRRHSPFRI